MPTDEPRTTPRTTVVSMETVAHATPYLYPMVDAADNSGMRPPEPKNPPRTTYTATSTAAAAKSSSIPTTAAEPSSFGRLGNLPAHLVSYSVRGFGRRTVEWGYYTPAGGPMVIVPSSTDQSEDLTGEPEEEVPPEGP